MSVRPETVSEAVMRADVADATSGVETAIASLRDVDDVMRVFDETWGPGRGPDRALLVAAVSAGTTVLVARHDGEVVGAAFGFLGWDGGVHVHSHMNAVLPVARGLGAGSALKLRQRAICLDRGIATMRWTFDPLIRRNAHLNLVRLGAEVEAFLPDFYGELRDTISRGDRSDRFEVVWRLDSIRTRRALDRAEPPHWHPAAAPFAIPADFERLRRVDPATAATLRESSRDYFARLAEPGMRIELDPTGHWVLTRDDPDGRAATAAGDDDHDDRED